jgi:hypothetical protein
MSTEPVIRWAPRVSQNLIRRLYETEARGLLDDELVDQAGIALYARCDSIMKVTAAHRGRIACGRCENVIVFPEGEHWRNRSAPFACASCGWTATWAAYLATYQKKQLHSGSAERVFAGFVERYPRARSAREKMLAIDWLLHEFHVHYQFGETRPAASNVIEGSVREVLRLLDELAGAEGATEWRERAKSSVFGRHLTPGPRRDGD